MEMTGRELLIEFQHKECEMAENNYYVDDKLYIKDKRYIENANGHIDRAYYLGLLIDNMPIELAEVEI